MVQHSTMCCMLLLQDSKGFAAAAVAKAEWVKGKKEEKAEAKSLL